MCRVLSSDRKRIANDFLRETLENLAADADYTEAPEHIRVAAEGEANEFETA